ncbi:RidA family protein [Herpetosiphon llansteffanensis]|uniref:RidA family protein n=1 Tax=Herpetosiphon llansteffanensis TaxID=2094568 RepID=UPI000D7CB492|nr:RidA family protein [Herpetosiphon llansteffanensis]
MSSITLLNPAGMPAANGYSHVAEVRGGRTIYLAGQVALNVQGEVVGLNDLEAQTRQVFANLQAGLAAVGATFEHVVKLNYYLLDISQIAVVRTIRDLYVNVSQPPTSTAVEVRRFVRDEFLIEIDAIAVID